jgi:hypothetical protein
MFFAGKFFWEIAQTTAQRLLEKDDCMQNASAYLQKLSSVMLHYS